MAARKVAKTTHLDVKAPSFQTATFTIRGTTPYVQHKFSAKVVAQLRAQQEVGDKRRRTKKNRAARDFDSEWQAATHRLPDGRCGIPANAFRAAMISACRICGVVMTRAKLAVFVEADDFDPTDLTPLVAITKGEPRRHDTYGRTETGVVMPVCRPMWAPGWEAEVRIRFDADAISLEDVANLLARVGQQVGIGEGRPDSKKSVGMGWGLFELA